ncbi:hypothetical protein JOD57_002531 [Geodermatophilus bullaregiensis]|uniref:Mut7-C RNAse domain-containing protein n=1 Tax=Geodermatophilus bullaregiensis TaxID=1564160 RepID=UPI00195DAB67|nr:Mut7-C RNAse domain-containing protein [Geodermatophilus bullaregiensis]MBM7806694.1 hypothetical protein [Geodermatophilus bullaregiensis]
MNLQVSRRGRREPHRLSAGGVVVTVDDALRPLLPARDRAAGRRVLPADPGTTVGHLVQAAGVPLNEAGELPVDGPPLAPLTRCPACNGQRAAVDAAAVADRLEPGTRRTATVFSRCARCGRVYWRGAHARRIDALVARARALTGRGAVVAPEAPLARGGHGSARA